MILKYKFKIWITRFNRNKLLCQIAIKFLDTINFCTYFMNWQQIAIYGHHHWIMVGGTPTALPFI